MTSRSNPDWLLKLIAEEGEAKPIDAHHRNALVKALQAATAPQPIKDDLHRRILQYALVEDHAPSASELDDPFAAPTEDEIVAAAQTRECLDSIELVESLRAAYSPSGSAAGLEARPRRGSVSHAVALVTHTRKVMSFAIGSALVAAFALWWTSPNGEIIKQSSLGSEAHAALNQSHTTRLLFSEPFNSSTPSERIDKIAMVRQRELRDNRFALWGIK